MVALLHDRPSSRLPAPAGCRPDRRDRRPGHLRLVHDQRQPRPVPVSVVLAVAAVVLLLATVGLRVLQGPPPASSWAELRAATVAAGAPAPVPGDVVIRVAPGETLWAIAQRHAPGRDPRPVVDALARANGGSQVQAGQDLVVPASLVGG